MMILEGSFAFASRSAVASFAAFSLSFARVADAKRCPDAGRTTAARVSWACAWVVGCNESAVAGVPPPAAKAKPMTARAEVVDRRSRRKNERFATNRRHACTMCPLLGLRLRPAHWGGDTSRTISRARDQKVRKRRSGRRRLGSNPGLNPRPTYRD